MKNNICSEAKLRFKLDGNTEKMKRSNGFGVPSLFEDMIGSNENDAIARMLSKKNLSQLDRPKLEELNKIFLRKLPLTSPPSIKERQTLKEIIELR